MTPESLSVASLKSRLDALIERGQALEAEGLPFPTTHVYETFRQAVAEGELQVAADVVKRAEALLNRAANDWTWVRELLRRADELRAIAGTIGVDLGILDNRVGNPRKRLMAEPLSSGSLEKAAASASLALAVLNDAVPKFCVQEAQALGGSIRSARDRGEEVTEAVRSFSRLLQAIQDQNLSTAAQRLVETRRAVARIPRAPALPPLSPREEEEILLEARNLARRLQRIKGKARDASSAARLMAQVRAAISEDRRYGTPEEEIEQLWAEVDRLTHERNRAAASAGASRRAPAATVGEPAAPIRRRPPEPERPEERLGAKGEEEPAAETEESRPRTVRPSFYVPYVPPEERVAEEPEESGDSPPAGRARNRYRPRP
ncbi:MAG TPA: hypothetical protein VEH28_00970 [Thermoplasmata archaeon]|nr:hypothetical protein [Thermoplasmata archaeon]